MTMLDERPNTATEPSRGSARAPLRSASPTATWTFASRLARREVRRRPGRTLLVMVLVALPVIAMSSASILARTLANGNGDSFSRQFGTAELVINTSTLGPDAEPTDPFARAPEFPAGTESTDRLDVYTSITADHDGDVRTTYTRVTDVDLTSPITAKLIVIDEGRAPIASNEALLSPDVADRLGVDLGDRLRLVRPNVGDVEVVGIGRNSQYFDDSVMVFGEFDRGLVRPGYGSIFTFVDLPDSLTPTQINELINGFSIEDGGVIARGSDFGYADEAISGQQLAWGWVAGAIGFVAVGIVIAAAFATSARRQLVTIGQLSANGASERLVRRTMGLQGAWTGFFGAVAGVGLVIVGAFVADSQGWLQQFANRALGPIQVRPIDLIVVVVTAIAASTCAALVPARSASRIPVLTALAGRRPVATPPRWLVPAGAVLVVGGLFLLFGAAGTNEPSDFTAALAVLGSLGVLFGMVCSSPLIVAGVGRVGSRFGGIVRLAARSLDRGRARSAAVLTAVATVGALTIAGATTVGLAERAEANNDYRPDLTSIDIRSNGDTLATEFDLQAASAKGEVFDPPPRDPGEIPASIVSGLDRIVPDANLIPLTQVIIDPLPYDYGNEDQPITRAADDRYDVYDAVVADDALRGSIDLTDDQQALLDEVGYLPLVSHMNDRAVIRTSQGDIDLDLTDPRAYPSNGDVIAVGDTIDMGGSSSVVDERTVVLRDGNNQYIGDVLVSAEFVAENGLDTAVSRLIGHNPTDLTKAQRDELQLLSSGFESDAWVAPDTSVVDADLGAATSWYVSVEYPESQTPWGLIKLGVAVTSLVMVLFVVAVGLSLAATESRDERDVLHAVGAAPKTLRRVSAAKAWVLTTGAAVVAIPTGYVTMFVIARATDSYAPFPFLLAGALLIVIPAVAAATTFVVSSIAQRVRPLTYSGAMAD